MKSLTEQVSSGKEREENQQRALRALQDTAAKRETENLQQLAQQVSYDSLKK